MNHHHRAIAPALADIGTLADAPTDPDAFLLWAAEQPEGHRYELSRGRVTAMMMIHVKRNHARVVRNLNAALSRVYPAADYLITTADFGVRTPFGIRFPDVLVEPEGGPGDERASEAPILIAEVLSPSTAAIDFRDKVDEYCTIPTLQAYLILSQDEPRLWIFARGSEGFPSQPQMIAGRTETVAVPGLPEPLAMADLFFGIPDPK